MGFLKSNLLFVRVLTGLAIFSSSLVWADVLTIEAVIKSVDAKDRSITVTKTTKGKAKDIDLEVDRKAKIRLEGKDAAMASLKPGQKASITFESELAVVTKIEVGETIDSSSVTEEVFERRLEGHSKPVLSVSFNPLGKFFASAGADETVRIWSIDPKDPVATVVSHPISKSSLAKAGVVQIVYSPSGKMLVSGGADGSLRFWDVNTEKPKLLNEISGNNALVGALAFSPDGKLLASSERQFGTMRLWELTDGKVGKKDISRLEGKDLWSLSFSPSGKELVGSFFVKGKPSKGELWIWDVSKSPVSKKLLLETDQLPRSARYSPDGRTIAFSENSLIRFVDAQTGQQVGILDCSAAGKNEPVTAIAFSPNGKLLASCGYDTKIRVWDAGTLRLIRTLQGADPGTGLEQLAFSPDGQFLISGALDRSVRVWNLKLDEKK